MSDITTIRLDLAKNIFQEHMFGTVRALPTALSH